MGIPYYPGHILNMAIAPKRAEDRQRLLETLGAMAASDTRTESVRM